MKKQILEAKCKLYELLLSIPNDVMTENELDIMYLLSIDEQIQSILTEKSKIK